MRLKAIFYILAALAAVFIPAYLLFTKSHKDISQSAPDHLISANQLADFYEKNESSANSKYLGKVLQVSGHVVSLERTGAVVDVIELAGNSQSVIRCALSHSGKDHAINYKQGTEITIKGICIGLLQDVNMRDCILLNQTE